MADEPSEPGERGSRGEPTVASRSVAPASVPRRPPPDRAPFSPLMLLATALALVVLVAVAGRWMMDRFGAEPAGVPAPTDPVPAVEQAPFSRVAQSAEDEPSVARGAGVVSPSGQVAAAEEPSPPEADGVDSPHMGTLEVLTHPPGARVTLDGRLVGETPLTLRELAGLAKLGISKDGYQSVHRSVDFQAGRRSELGPITLEPLPGLLGPVELFGVGLEGGFVSIDGGERLALPARVELSSGVHKLQVFAPDGEVYTLARSVSFDAEGSPVKLDLQEL
jgi:hypothetical protein